MNAPELYPRLRRRFFFVRLRQFARAACDLAGLGPGLPGRLACVAIFAAALVGAVLCLAVACKASTTAVVTAASVTFGLASTFGVALVLVGTDAGLSAARERIAEQLPVAKAAWEENKKSLRAEREVDEPDLPPKKATYTFEELIAIYRRYARLKGWNTADRVVREKVESWRDGSIGAVGLAIEFHERGTDNAKHLGRDAEAVAADATIQSRVVVVAGTAHANEDGSDRLAIAGRCAAWETLDLRREPKNKFDPDAIAVYRRNGQQLGYLPRSIAAESAVQMKAKCRHAALFKASGDEVTIVLFVTKPGVSASKLDDHIRAWLVQ